MFGAEACAVGCDANVQSIVASPMVENQPAEPVGNTQKLFAIGFT